MPSFLSRNLVFVLLLVSHLLSIGSPALSNTPEIDSLETVLKNGAKDTNRVMALNQISWALRGNEPDKAESYVLEALSLAKDLGYQKGLARAYNNLGAIYDNRGEYDQALEYYTSALELSLELGDKDRIAASYNNLGLIYSKQGYYSKTLKYYFKCLEIDEEMDNKSGMANTYNNIGVVYFHQNNIAKVLEYFKKSVSLREELDDQEGMAGSYHNIAAIHLQQNQYAEALEYYEKALVIAKELGDKMLLSSIFNSIGGVYSKKNNYANALIYLQQGYDIEVELGNKRGTAYSLAGMGVLFAKQGNHEKAIRYYERCVAIADDIGAKHPLKEAYKRLAATHALLGKYEEAHRYLKLYSDLKDTIFNEESAREIADMQTKYDTEKQELQISALEMEKTQQAAITAAENRRQQTIIWSVVGGLAMAIVFASFLFNRFQVTKKQKNIIEDQKMQVDAAFGELSLKNQQITDSINYAKRIQEAILPSEDTVKKHLDAFVLYRPKDVVSGDFYWSQKVDDHVLFTAVDCTGHGVPGAFMSIIGINLLNDIVKTQGITEPARILGLMKEGVIQRLKQGLGSDDARDGMDIALCCLDLNKMKLQYSGARNSLYLIRDGKLEEYKADRMSVGIGHESEGLQFTNHLIKLTKGDCLYVFSDGYADQKGGPKGKKFYYPPFQQLLIDIQEKDMSQQKEHLNKVITEWKGDQSQMDDMLVLGVRV